MRWRTCNWTRPRPACSSGPIAQRYEKRQPIVLTSNKAFGEWAQVFASDPVMASAALDRLLHRATVVNVRGESYRLREKRRAGDPGASQTTAAESGKEVRA